ncbi:MAG: glycosyltransferase [Acidimicrobiales bacterium]|nr:glycosyltransferase [Acidimicrobiales bacterium]
MSFHDFSTWRREPVSLAPQLSVVIPAFNEERRIVPTIGAIAAYLSEENHQFEIIVSDDGSTDDTVARVRSLELRNVRVVGPGYNRGKGAAVRTGVEEARGDYVLITDADLSTPIQEIAPMLAHAENGVPVVIGSRAADGATEMHRSGLRRLLSAGLRSLTTVALGLPIADTQCGFKLLRRDVAHELFAMQQIEGFSFDLELLWLARGASYQITEVPVRWYDAPGSKVQPLKTTLAFIRDLATIRLRHRRPRRRPNRQAMHVGVVTALPPSRTTLNEYGHHLVHRFAGKESVAGVVAFVESEPTPAEFPIATAAPVTIVPSWRFNSVANPLRLLRAVRRERPDVVFFNLHFTSFGSNPIAAATGLFTPLVLRLFGFRTVVLLHNLVDTVDLADAGHSRNKVVDRVVIGIARLMTRVVLRADLVATTTPTAVDILRDRYGGENVYLAPHGTFEIEDDPVGPGAIGPRRILAFGKFGTYKRLEVLLDAFAELPAELADVELVIAGSDSPNASGYMAAMAERAGDLAGVTFTGYVEENEVPDLFRSADVVAFPYESTTGSSGPLHQAGTYGCAAVVPRIGDFLDVLDEEGYAAEPFEAGDANSLAVALGRVLGDRAYRDELGEQNRVAAQALPLDDVVDWHLLHFEELLA